MECEYGVRDTAPPSASRLESSVVRSRQSSGEPFSFACSALISLARALHARTSSPGGSTGSFGAMFASPTNDPRPTTLGATTRSPFGYGSGSISRRCTTLKIAVFAPMPSADVAHTARAQLGLPHFEMEAHLLLRVAQEPGTGRRQSKEAAHAARQKFRRFRRHHDASRIAETVAT